MKKLNLNLFSLFFFLLTTILSAEEKIISGKAKITDGDTIVINQSKIRFFGIDAPEKKQICKKNYLKFLIFNFKKNYECGKVSSIKLKNKIKGKNIRCVVKKKDKYKRYLGICYLGKEDLSSWLVKNGYAVAYQKYSKKYLLDEQYAKNNTLGLWDGTFLRPEEWRRNFK
tara:strand:- start:221 stop:730 length:510 start_codon:yes stop_codon:yes gene_type:complete